MVIRADIAEAIKNNKPVVALESTIISHGMPYPENVKTALEVEQVVLDNGAIPATIAILGGKIHVGLTTDDMEFLAHSKDILKASRMDIPIIINRKLNASTTVAATMICADLAGIKLFVTGGIGGVHKGASETFDVSADLQELAKTNVAVVCAGAKAILDLEKTMEYLETFGVPVIGYQTDYLPAFYSRESNIKLLYRADSPEEIAGVISTKAKLGLEGAVLITNPLPEEFSLDFNEMNILITEAIKAAEAKHIKGKEITPFLLDYLQKVTKKQSLETNIALIKSNAELGAKIAVALSSC